MQCDGAWYVRPMYSTSFIRDIVILWGLVQMSGSNRGVSAVGLKCMACKRSSVRPRYSPQKIKLLQLIAEVFYFITAQLVRASRLQAGRSSRSLAGYSPQKIKLLQLIAEVFYFITAQLVRASRLQAGRSSRSLAGYSPQKIELLHYLQKFLFYKGSVDPEHSPHLK